MKLGDVLEHMNIGAVWLLIGFIIVTVIVDLIIPQAIAKWALLAPIFIPLFIRLGVAPQTVLAAYRVGDSPVNVITPLMAYFPLIVIFAQRYRKDAGIGTVVVADAAVRRRPVDRLDAVLRRLVPDRDPARPRRRPSTPGSTPRPRRAAAQTHERQHDHLPRARRRSSSCSSGTACRSRSSRSASALSLWATGVLDLDQALAGFGDPAVLFIASLFVVSEALDATGRHRLGRAGADRPGRRRAARGCSC